MVNTEYTDITLLLDRSGSMSAIKTDMDGAMKEFIDEQRKVDKPCTINAYQFDAVCETIYEGMDIQKVDAPKIIPRDFTALYDAIGQTIKRIGTRLAAMREEDRPGRVLFVIITDGYENASREFSHSQIVDMITHQRDIYSWNFVFIGANIDSYAIGTSLGIKRANVLNYTANSTGVHKMSGIMGASMSDMRSCPISTYQAACSSGNVKGVFTAEDQKSADDDIS